MWAETIVADRLLLGAYVHRSSRTRPWPATGGGQRPVLSVICTGFIFEIQTKQIPDTMKPMLTVEEKILECQEKINYKFTNPQLLQSALTHASGANKRVESNERLEFLGDSILGMVICDHLYHRHPTLLEGELTKIKSNVVSRRICAKVARRLGLDAYLILGRGMLKSDLPRSLLSDVYEAIIAAVFLDGGLAAVKSFIETSMQEELVSADEDAGIGNYKSVLQHYCVNASWD